MRFFSISVVLSVILASGPALAADLNNTKPFTVVAYNASFPSVNNKTLWIHGDGSVYLDAQVSNPRLSYPLVAYLKDSYLLRIRENNSATGTQGYLNFGTYVILPHALTGLTLFIRSNVCCDYSVLNFSNPSTIPYPGTSAPFFLTGNRQNQLVFGIDPAYQRYPWYACIHPNSTLYMVSLSNRKRHKYWDRAGVLQQAVLPVSRSWRWRMHCHHLDRDTGSKCYHPQSLIHRSYNPIPYMNSFWFSNNKNVYNVEDVKCSKE